MVETWNEIIQYDEYYDQCAPEQCTYTFTSRKNLLQVITTTVGLFGGLSVGLRVIVLLFAFCIRRIMHSTEEENNMTGKYCSILFSDSPIVTDPSHTVSCQCFKEALSKL